MPIRGLKASAYMSINKQFESLLAEFIKVTGRSMECARELANMTIVHYAGPNKNGDDKGGDLSMAQMFLDAMTKHCPNYVRREAYLKWLGDHSPIEFDRASGKIVKDKSDGAVDFRVDVALKVSFWEYLPEPSTVDFTTNDVIVALQRTVAKYTKTTKDGKPRFKSTDGGKADSTIALASTMIAELKTVIANDLGVGRVRTPTFGELTLPERPGKPATEVLGDIGGNEPIKLPDASDVIPTAEKATAAAS